MKHCYVNEKVGESFVEDWHTLEITQFFIFVWNNSEETGQWAGKQWES